jgi:hypothetical protein
VIQVSTSDVEKSIQVSDADAKKAYDGRKEQYRSEEERKVAIGTFELTPSQKSLTGTARTNALQPLSNQAWNFAQAVVDKSANFADQAKKYGANLSETGFFSTSAPDPTLANVQAAVTDAYKLSSDYPSSDVLQGENGYYVLHLEGVKPSMQLTFDQAKAQVIADIKKDRAAQIMQTTATQVKARLAAEIQAGRTLDQAAKDAGVTVQDIPEFSLMDVSKLDIPDAQPIVENAITLNSGQFSEFVPTSTGGMFVYMKSREPVDARTAAIGRDIMQPQFLRQKQQGTFLEWLRLARAAARLEITHSS